MRILFLLVCTGGWFFLFADNIDYLSVSGGCFDPMRQGHRSFETRVEYRPSFNLQTIRPIFGAAWIFNGSAYLYSGVGVDLFFTKKLYLSPNIAAGIYIEGSGKKLGYPLEFRSSAEIGWRFENHYKIAIQICHVSNASLGKTNPGCESLAFTLYFPINKRVKKCK